MAKPLGEFDFIEQCLIAQAANGQSFYQHAEALGIGDDCAVLPPLPADEQMVVSTDMLVEGRHYVPDVDPRALGHKVLAVNLSDLAAMGAQPIAFTLAAALRGLNAEWLNEFLAGVLDLARETQCALIGGDTTGVPNGGPEVFSVTVMGRVPRGGALRRSGVRDGDDLWVSGALGDPAYAVSERHQDEKLLRPNPRLSLGLGLRSLAHAAIDVSDGLHSEVMHLLRASGGLGARLNLDALPLGPVLRRSVNEGRLIVQQAHRYAMTGGDEYELVFSAGPAQRDAIERLGRELQLPLTRIGAASFAPQAQIQWHHAQGQPVSPELQQQVQQGGFRHF